VLGCVLGALIGYFRPMRVITSFKNSCHVGENDEVVGRDDGMSLEPLPEAVLAPVLEEAVPLRVRRGRGRASPADGRRRGIGRAGAPARGSRGPAAPMQKMEAIGQLSGGV
jgi:hypothetical protein